MAHASRDSGKSRFAPEEKERESIKFSLSHSLTLAFFHAAPARGLIKASAAACITDRLLDRTHLSLRRFYARARQSCVLQPRDEKKKKARMLYMYRERFRVRAFWRSIGGRVGGWGLKVSKVVEKVI